MIGLLFFAFLGIWLVAAIVISVLITKWLGVSKHRGVIGMALFPIVFCAPIADDLIGMWQFRQLCEKEAVVTLSPDWKRVKRAAWVDLPVDYYNHKIIPITGQSGQYINLDSNQPFMVTRSLFTQGGFLRRFIGLGNGSSCSPENERILSKQINVVQLMKNGEEK